MHKKSIAIFFTIIFAALISAPSIITAIDDTVDVSIFYTVTEEENENIKITFSDSDVIKLEHIFITDIKENLGYYFKNYPKPHLNLIFPPPEKHIL
jgi:hypothetical protein